MGSNGTGYEDQTFQVGDLGCFSMRAIYDALASSAQLGTSPLAQRRPRHLDPEDSDCSWTQDDDNGTFYFDMQRKLNSFALSDGQPTWTTPFLSKSQRRFVHATAQILRLGHASLGPPGKLRRMIVFKDLGASSVLGMSVPHTNAQDLASPSGLLAIASPSKKRRRLERSENGFPCHYCEKLFNRASERTKHEQAHQPKLTSRHPCPVCGKGFRYPKDLRRHSKVHDKMPGSGPQSLGSSFSSAPLGSTLTADSRIPSDTSLTFSSNTVSKDASPFLLGQNGGQMPDLDLEPLVLDENAWSGGGVDDWLFDPQSGFGNIDDEDFLEMAKVRK